MEKSATPYSHIVLMPLPMIVILLNQHNRIVRSLNGNYYYLLNSSECRINFAIESVALVFLWSNWSASWLYCPSGLMAFLVMLRTLFSDVWLWWCPKGRRRSRSGCYTKSIPANTRNCYNRLSLLSLSWIQWSWGRIALTTLSRMIQTISNTFSCQQQQKNCLRHSCR